MRTVCLCTPLEDPDRLVRAKAHFAEMGVGPVDYFTGLHKSTSGLDTSHLYMVDRGPSAPDQSPYGIGPHPVNIWLGHYMAWQALKLSNEPEWFIIECDAKFQRGWSSTFYWALATMHLRDPDWDLIYMGSCGAAGRVKEYITTTPSEYGHKLAIIEGSGPQCNHAYVLRAKAVPVLETMRKVWAPIDIQQTVECFQHGVALPRGVPMFQPPARKLAVYTVLPRIVDQWDTEIGA